MENAKNRKKTLVIMAAGLASRYGGDKQTDGVGPHGETLMEYSIYDAIRAGFRKIVLIIQPRARQNMDDRIGKRIRNLKLPDGGGIETAYAYQDFSSIPDFYQIPEGRVKPFGTGHALLCAAESVREPFAVMNADDYYGADALRVMSDALEQLPDSGQAVMVGYILKNTLSRGGTVSRGICRVQNNRLCEITERLKIGYAPDGVPRDADSGAVLSPDDMVSMNLWGFAPSFFDALRSGFERFLRTEAGENIKAECQLPAVVHTEMAAGRLEVSVLRSASAWFGMTYQEDRAAVSQKLRELRDQGVYPDRLWEAI